MIVASTIAPFESVSPFFCKNSPTPSKILLRSLCFSRRCRKRVAVGSSDSRSRPKLLNANKCAHAGRLSTTSSTIGSDRLNQSCSKCIRSMRSKLTTGRQPPPQPSGSRVRSAPLAGPRYHLVHLRQKLLLAHGLAEPFKVAGRRRQLLHRAASRPPVRVLSLCADLPVQQFCEISLGVAFRDHAITRAEHSKTDSKRPFSCSHVRPYKTDRPEFGQD